MLEKINIFLKTNRKFFVIGAVFLFFCLLIAVPILVDAMLTMSAQRNLEIQQKNNVIAAAILNNDYATWSSLVSDEKLKTKVNASNFSQYTTAYQLLQQGKVEEADLIKKQLALKQNFVAVAVKSQEIDNAINANDYNAWRAIVGSDAESKVTSDNFTTYAEAYRLIKQGDLWEANKIKRTIDLKPTLEEMYYSSSR